MTDLLARIDPGWLVFIGVFMGALSADRRHATADIAARNRCRGTLAPDAADRRRHTVGRAYRHPPAAATEPNAGSSDLDLRNMLLAAGLPPQPMLFGLGAAALLCVTTVGLMPMIGAPAALGLSVMLWILLPLMVLSAMRTARLKRISAQLPDALDLMARALKAGHPLSSSIGTVAETMPDPIGTEFGIMVDQISYGDDTRGGVPEAGRTEPERGFQLPRRQHCDPARHRAEISAEFLACCAGVIRGRIMMRRKIKAMSAEGRISALILSCIPFLMVGLNSIITPSYYGDVVQDPLFMPLALVALGLIFLNGFVLFRLVNFRI